MTSSASAAPGWSKNEGIVQVFVDGEPTGSTKPVRLPVPTTMKLAGGRQASFLLVLKDKFSDLDISKLALSVKGKYLDLTTPSSTMQQIYEEHKSDDGCLHISISTLDTQQEIDRAERNTLASALPEELAEADIPASSGHMPNVENLALDLVNNDGFSEQQVAQEEAVRLQYQRQDRSEGLAAHLKEEEEVHDLEAAAEPASRHNLPSTSEAIIDTTRQTQAHEQQLDAQHRDFEMKLQAKSLECDALQEQVARLQIKVSELEGKLLEAPLPSEAASQERISKRLRHENAEYKVKVEQLETSLQVSEAEREWNKAGLEEALKKIESLKSEGQKGDQVRLRARAAEARCTELERQLQERDELIKQMKSSAMHRSEPTECPGSATAASSEAGQVSDDAIEDEAAVRDTQEERLDVASLCNPSHACEMGMQPDYRNLDGQQSTPVVRCAEQVQDFTCQGGCPTPTEEEFFFVDAFTPRSWEIGKQEVDQEVAGEVTSLNGPSTSTQHEQAKVEASSEQDRTDKVMQVELTDTHEGQASTQPDMGSGKEEGKVETTNNRSARDWMGSWWKQPTSASES